MTECHLSQWVGQLHRLKITKIFASPRMVGEARSYALKALFINALHFFIADSSDIPLLDQKPISFNL